MNLLLWNSCVCFSPLTPAGIAVGTQHGMKNQTAVREFILLGFSYGLQVQASLYLIFLATYMVTITENAIIIFVVKRNRHLQKPMYYFLGNLSFLEICYVSVTLPRLLLGFRSQSMTISFSSCMTQLYFFISLMCTECVIWDRYLAVCHPLRYPAIMTHKLCLQLLILSWAGGFSISLVKVSLVSQLTSWTTSFVTSLPSWAFPALTRPLQRQWTLCEPWWSCWYLSWSLFSPTAVSCQLSCVCLQCREGETPFPLVPPIWL